MGRGLQPVSPGRACLHPGRERSDLRGREQPSAPGDVRAARLPAETVEPYRLADRQGRHDPDAQLHRHTARDGTDPEIAGIRPDIAVVHNQPTESAVAI